MNDHTTTPTSEDQQAIIRLEQSYPQSPSAIWRALTEPDLIAKWWAPGDVRPVVGHRFTLDMGQWGTQECEVLRVEDGRLIQYSFAEGKLDTKITWSIEPEGTGTRLTMVHEGFDLDSPMGKSALEGMRAGWPKILPRIGTAAEAA